MHLPTTHASFRLTVPETKLLLVEILRFPFIMLEDLYNIF